MIVNVIVMIDGREAIPVRAIPLLTYGETMSADSLAAALGWNSPFYKFRGLNAHCIEDNTAKPIDARWWENVASVGIDAVQQGLKRRQNEGLLTEQEAFSKWQTESVQALPAGVFVWKDQFEPLHVSRYDSDHECFLKPEAVFRAINQETRVRLDYAPFISDLKIQQLVMEGFTPGVIDTPPKQASTSEAVEMVEQRRNRYLESFEEEEKNGKRGALTRLAKREGVDRANMRKDIDKALAARTEKKSAGSGWSSQLIQDGKRAG